MGLIDFLLSKQAIIKPYQGQADGEPVYGEPETRPCRVEIHTNLTDGVKTVAAGQYDNAPANATMFTTGEAIPLRSSVVIEGHEYTVAECKVMVGFKAHHLEVKLL